MCENKKCGSQCPNMVNGVCTGGCKKAYIIVTNTDGTQGIAGGGIHIKLSEVETAIASLLAKSNEHPEWKSYSLAVEGTEIYDEIEKLLKEREEG